MLADGQVIASSFLSKNILLRWPWAGITLLSGVSASTMCLFQATPQVTVHSKSEAEPAEARGQKLNLKYLPRRGARSHLYLFPSCWTATPCGEEYLTPCSSLLCA